MSGHSKWSTIKRKKAANDAKRGKVFTRLAREITIAARDSGDIDANFALRLAVDRARTANMPKENIERAIKRGTGELKDGAQFEEVLYEAYAPHGIALMLEVATDNRNRALSEMKHLLGRSGGSMAEPGAVGWQFENKGYITISAETASFDDVFLVAAEAGADDVAADEDLIEIITAREELHVVVDALKDAGFRIDEARLDWVPNISKDIATEDALKIMGLIESLEELDDMQAVYSNLNVTDDLMDLFEVEN
nr:YebC/PmpR family DNA-binding transcriptional regulator [Anaerolineae bacterium]